MASEFAIAEGARSARSEPGVPVLTAYDACMLEPVADDEKAMMTMMASLHPSWSMNDWQYALERAADRPLP